METNDGDNEGNEQDGVLAREILQAIGFLPSSSSEQKKAGKASSSETKKEASEIKIAVGGAGHNIWIFGVTGWSIAAKFTNTGKGLPLHGFGCPRRNTIYNALNEPPGGVVGWFTVHCQCNCRHLHPVSDEEELIERGAIRSGNNNNSYGNNVRKKCMIT